MGNQIKISAWHNLKLHLLQSQYPKLLKAISPHEPTLESCGEDSILLWQTLTKLYEISACPLEAKKAIFDTLFAPQKEGSSDLRPVWFPEAKDIEKSNAKRWMEDLNLGTYDEFLSWTQTHRSSFWSKAVKDLGVVFDTPASKTLEPSSKSFSPLWFPEGRLNIVESCFLAPAQKTAVVAVDHQGQKSETSYSQLRSLARRVSQSLIDQGLKPGDAVAIDMTMNVESVYLYLGIIGAGMVAVSIADSFAPDEIATRLRISKAKLIFTQDYLLRGGKKFPLYEKVRAAGAPRAVVHQVDENQKINLNTGDVYLHSFLGKKEIDSFAVSAPQTPINILFSSGTTGEPKAIAWDHLTAIKAATDGKLHQDIGASDVVAWPTNLGWMMGPWLIFASLMNQSTMALYYEPPLESGFGKFVEEARITVLGMIPSIVKQWKVTGQMEAFDWSSLKCFSSTGECSNFEDYFYLMSLAGFRPVIEYCGGTEIGGGYLTGTLLKPQIPGTFNSVACGLSLVILDESHQPAKKGEAYLIPPSLGLSTTLLNRDHDEIYYENTPSLSDGQVLRRHGDEIEDLGGGYYRGLGRADDTMNLGGIKISSSEIERVVLLASDKIKEIAAVGVAPAQGGPSELVLFVVLGQGAPDMEVLKKEMQQRVRSELNPLFKISSLVEMEKLPRTASNKVMRRVLRDHVIKNRTKSKI